MVGVYLVMFIVVGTVCRINHLYWGQVDVPWLVFLVSSVPSESLFVHPFVGGIQHSGWRTRCPTIWWTEAEGSHCSCLADESHHTALG